LQVRKYQRCETVLNPVFTCKNYASVSKNNKNNAVPVKKILKVCNVSHLNYPIILAITARLPLATGSTNGTLVHVPKAIQGYTKKF